MKVLLQLANIYKRFDGVAALSDVSLAVAEDEIVGLIGPNGSGKTTVFDIISRLTEPSSGQVSLFAEDMLKLKPHEVAGRGLARLFQPPYLCPGLTAFENVAVGSYAQRSRAVLPFLKPKRARETFGFSPTDALKFVGISGKWDDFPDSLSHYDMRRVELARALTAEPVLLLLDEPTSGFAASERDDFAALIRQIRERAVAILIVEHDL